MPLKHASSTPEAGQGRRTAKLQRLADNKAQAKTERRLQRSESHWLAQVCLTSRLAASQGTVCQVAYGVRECRGISKLNQRHRH